MGVMSQTKFWAAVIVQGAFYAMDILVRAGNIEHSLCYFIKILDDCVVIDGNDAIVNKIQDRLKENAS
jgi:hypothetical protein